MTQKRRLAFARISRAALLQAETICQRWIPEGHREGREWVARNPKRADKRLGSFKVNTTTGAWADFATGDSGGDLIALAAWLFDLGQGEAALKIATMLGIDPYDA